MEKATWCAGNAPSGLRKEKPLNGGLCVRNYPALMWA